MQFLVDRDIKQALLDLFQKVLPDTIHAIIDMLPDTKIGDKTVKELAREIFLNPTEVKKFLGDASNAYELLRDLVTAIDNKDLLAQAIVTLELLSFAIETARESPLGKERAEFLDEAEKYVRWTHQALVLVRTIAQTANQIRRMDLKDMDQAKAAIQLVGQRLHIAGEQLGNLGKEMDAIAGALKKGGRAINNMRPDVEWLLAGSIVAVALLLAYKPNDKCRLFPEDHFKNHPSRKIIKPREGIVGGPWNGLRRATGAEARLDRTNITGGRPPKDDPPGFPVGAQPGGRAFVARAHLLAEVLGGPGTAENLVPLCQSINKQMYDIAENEVRMRVLRGQVVDYEVVVFYNGLADAVPSGITIFAASIEPDGTCWYHALSLVNPTNLRECR